LIDIQREAFSLSMECFDSSSRVEIEIELRLTKESEEDEPWSD